MRTTRHPVDFAYTPQELQALFRYAHDHDVEKGGRDDARQRAINVWSHHWHTAPRGGIRDHRHLRLHWDPPALMRLRPMKGSAWRTSCRSSAD